MNLIEFNNTSEFISLVKEKSRFFLSSNKTILIIEPYGSFLSMLKNGFIHQYNFILLTADADMRKVPESIIREVQLAIKIDTASEEKMMNLVGILWRFISFDAVIPGFEYFVSLAVKISHYLDLPAMKESCLPFFRNKARMREKLLDHGVAVPKFFILNSRDDFVDAIKHMTFPIVCKPVDAAGSVHVKKVTTWQEAEQAVLRITEGRDILWGHSLSKQVLIEEYISGKEYSLEGVVINGRIINFSITEKFLSDEIDFVEIGHVVNAHVPLSLKLKLENYLGNILKILGADFCPFHAEIRLDHADNPILMEVASRLPGDRIIDLVNLSKGINYFDAIYAAYFGEEYNLPIVESKYSSGIRFFYRPTLSRYHDIWNMELTKPHINEICIYYQQNQIIPEFPKALKRIGHVIMMHDDYDFLIKELSQFDENIIFYGE